MPFESGQVITRRYLRGPWVTWAQPMRVISDDEAGLLLWHPVGSDIARLIDADGNTPHEIAVDRMRDPKLTLRSWTDYDILVLMRPDTAHAVWWCFQQGEFAGWYVNLEAPYVRRPDSVDTTRLRRPSTAPATPTAVRARPVRSSRPAFPVAYGSLSRPFVVSIRCAP